MSQRSHVYKSYNRAEVKEQYWLELLFPEDDYHHHCWYCCDECDSPWFNYYAGSYGEVNSMDEYHQMKVLTLLRLLSIGTARHLTEERGW